jgi:hypothetical protein
VTTFDGAIMQSSMADRHTFPQGRRQVKAGAGMD